MRFLKYSGLCLFVMCVQTGSTLEDNEPLEKLQSKLNEMREQYQHLKQKFIKMQNDHKASMERERKLGETQIANLMKIIGKAKHVVMETERNKIPSK